MVSSRKEQILADVPPFGDKPAWDSTLIAQESQLSCASRSSGREEPFQFDSTLTEQGGTSNVYMGEHTDGAKWACVQEREAELERVTAEALAASEAAEAQHSSEGQRLRQEREQLDARSVQVHTLPLAITCIPETVTTHTILHLHSPKALLTAHE